MQAAGMWLHGMPCLACELCVYKFFHIRLCKPLNWRRGSKRLYEGLIHQGKWWRDGIGVAGGFWHPTVLHGECHAKP